MPTDLRQEHSDRHPAAIREWLESRTVPGALLGAGAAAAAGLAVNANGAGLSTPAISQENGPSHSVLGAMANAHLLFKSRARGAFLFRPGGSAFVAGMPADLQPLIDLRRSFYFLRSPQQQFPGHAAGRLLLCGLSEFVSFFFQPLFKRLRVLDASTLGHVAGSFWKTAPWLNLESLSPFRLSDSGQTSRRIGGGEGLSN
jgi:hypothetical protein